MNVTIACVGKLKDRFYIDASAEYGKRLSRFCALTVREVRDEPIADKASPAVQRAAIERAHQDATKRAADIIAIGEMFAAHGGEKRAAEALRAGKTVDQFRADMLQFMATKPVPTADVGLTDKEARQYSFLRAINAQANPGDRAAQEAAAFDVWVGADSLATLHATFEVVL